MHRPPVHPVKRYAQLTLGVLLILAAGVVAPLPGPGGIFLFAGGLVLVLRHSPWARRRFARIKRRWPRVGGIVDRAMRRPSALRRHALRRHVPRRPPRRSRSASRTPRPMR